MSFRAGNLKDAQLPLYTLNGEVLCDSACVKYLGHFICSDLSDDTDILRQRRCLTIQGNILLRKFHMCSIGVRLALFRSFCSPMYTSQLWWNYKKCTMKRLLITYHNVFKMSISMSKYESTSVLCTVGWGKRWLIYNNLQTPNFHVRAMRSWQRHVHPGNYGRAYPDFSVLALWNGMSGHRLTEGGTECLGGIFQTGIMCGPCRQLALGPSA